MQSSYTLAQCNRYSSDDAHSRNVRLVNGPAGSLLRHALACYPSKLEHSAGPVCVETLGVSEGSVAVALRPVGEVTVRSEPSLVRLWDIDKSTQFSRARDRLSSFCRKLRRSISECITDNAITLLITHSLMHICVYCLSHQCSNSAFVFIVTRRRGGYQ